MITIIPDREGFLTQWDKNRTVIISGIDDEKVGNTVVHFSSPNDSQNKAHVLKAYVDDDGLVRAEFPNIFLTFPGRVDANIYTDDHTCAIGVLVVMPHEKPDDYIYEETEVLKYETLEKQIGNLDDLKTTAKGDLVSAINEAAESGGGGKVDTVTVNGTAQPIENKTVDITVDKTTVGLGNVDNTADADKPVSTAQATAIADAKKTGTDAQTALDTHKEDKANPHGVTKAQVGLGNVDNTSDADKPISTAQKTAIDEAKQAGLDAQTALNSKLDKAAVVSVTASATAGQAADAKSVWNMMNNLPDAGSGTDISLGLTGASVGDIVRTKSVDADGKPTEWVAAEYEEVSLISDVTTTERVNMISYTPPTGKLITDYVIVTTVPRDTEITVNQTCCLRANSYGGGVQIKNGIRSNQAFSHKTYTNTPKQGFNRAHLQTITSGGDMYSYSAGLTYAPAIQVYTPSAGVTFPSGTNVKIYGNLVEENNIENL